MEFWIYVNVVHRYAKVHLSSCAAPGNNGLGSHDAVDSALVGRGTRPNPPHRRPTDASAGCRGATGYLTSEDVGHCLGRAMRGVVAEGGILPSACRAVTATHDPCGVWGARRHRL
jgi:hypothetical protein